MQRFETLLTDLLEISRYDAGSVQLELEPTSLAHLAEDVIGSMQQLAEQHGTDVRLVAPGGYSPVEMDPRRVRRVVRNLLGNAIEHGEGRPIVITVDSDQQAVALGVRDYGLGMTPEDVERVFDRFWRADPSRTRTIGGTGLGLSIALGDARLHGGELAVWSELGRGSNFVLTLPRQGGRLTAPSPVPVDPGDDSIAAVDDLGLTQPIEVLNTDAADPRGRVVNARRGILSAVAALAVLVLSACAGLPVSGRSTRDARSARMPARRTSCSAPTSRSPGATPEQIVEGFIRAGSGPGPAANWERRARVPRARRSARRGSRRRASRSTCRTTACLLSPTEGAVELSLVAVATVDAERRVPADRGGRRRQLPFRLAQQDDGEWRITEAPDGVVLDRDVFPNVFHRLLAHVLRPDLAVPRARTCAGSPRTNAATRDRRTRS